MVLAWYMDDSTEDPRLEHHLDPPQEVPLNKISFLTRVDIYNVEVDDIHADESFKKLKEKNNYCNHDICLIEKSLDNYDKMLEKFYTEHFHDDDEVRLFLEGSGYFDVRDFNDKWIRIKAEKGDLLILPAGLYHRFTPDTKDYAKVMRLFTSQPTWAAIFRPTGEKKQEIEDDINKRESRENHLNILGRNSLQT